MSTLINFNGAILEDAAISVFDHGFLFGDSIYEVITTFNGNPCFLEPHLRRLRGSASGVQMVLPYSDEQLSAEIHRTLAAAANRESYIRLVITRGVGEIDLDPSTCSRPNLLIYVAAHKPVPPEYYRNGIHVALVSVKRNARESLNPGIKTGNYLNNVLARIEAGKLGAQDALMLSPWGNLTECTTSNFFFVKDGSLMTPSLESGILAGITRDVVIRLAQENGIPVTEKEWPPEILDTAEEAFVTGTVKRIVPVTRLSGKPVGDGKVGGITKSLMRLYENLLKANYGAVTTPPACR